MNVETPRMPGRFPDPPGEREEETLMFPTITAQLAAQRQADLIHTARRYHRVDGVPRTRRTDPLAGWARSARQAWDHHRSVAPRTASTPPNSSTPCCA